MIVDWIGCGLWWWCPLLCFQQQFCWGVTVCPLPDVTVDCWFGVFLQFDFLQFDWCSKLGNLQSKPQSKLWQQQKELSCQWWCELWRWSIFSFAFVSAFCHHTSDCTPCCLLETLQWPCMMIPSAVIVPFLMWLVNCKWTFWSVLWAWDDCSLSPWKIAPHRPHGIVALWPANLILLPSESSNSLGCIPTGCFTGLHPELALSKCEQHRQWQVQTRAHPHFQKEMPHHQWGTPQMPPKPLQWLPIVRPKNQEIWMWVSPKNTVPNTGSTQSWMMSSPSIAAIAGFWHPTLGCACTGLLHSALAHVLMPASTVSARRAHGRLLTQLELEWSCSHTSSPWDTVSHWVGCWIAIVTAQTLGPPSPAHHPTTHGCGRWWWILPRTNQRWKLTLMWSDRTVWHWLCIQCTESCSCTASPQEASQCHMTTDTQTHVTHTAPWESLMLTAWSLIQNTSTAILFWQSGVLWRYLHLHGHQQNMAKDTKTTRRCFVPTSTRKSSVWKWMQWPVANTHWLHLILAHVTPSAAHDFWWRPAIAEWTKINASTMNTLCDKTATQFLAAGRNDTKTSLKWLNNKLIGKPILTSWTTCPSGSKDGAVPVQCFPQWFLFLLLCCCSAVIAKSTGSRACNDCDCDTGIFFFFA